MNHSSELKNEQLALDNCEREQVHIPGRVQSFIAVIGITQTDFRIVCHSENCESILGLPSNGVLGLDLSDVFTNRKLVHDIRGALSVPSLQTQRERVGRFKIRPDDEDEFEIALSLGGDVAILEIEPVTEKPGINNSSIFQVRTVLASLAIGGGVDALLDSAVAALRKLTGYDRVMGYRFLHDGAGEVAAECRSPGVEPFLGLRYPAYDIPSQVRGLMVRLPLRLISDVNDPHSSMRSELAEPIDLSMCHARGVSPIHVEYLNNMGVCATMNISIVVGGELWGLFAFHHYRPRRLAADLRLVCELFGQLFSVQIQQELEKEVYARRRRAVSIRDSLSEFTEDTLWETLEHQWEDLAGTVDAHGMAIIRGDSVRGYGDVPEESVVRQIIESSAESLFSTDNIASINVPNATPVSKAQLKKSAGALAMRVSSSSETSVVFFRNEIIHNVRWAGEPAKNIDYGPNGPRLTPRHSFDEYTQTVKGKCEPWTRFDISAATELQSVFLDLIYRDASITNETFRKQKKYQDVLIAELSHRVKNILALVRSIARQTKDSSHSIENFTSAFEKRIGALATAHDLIGGTGVQWVSFEELVRIELKPFENNPGQRLEFSGPSVGLRADVAPVVALVVHELVSNASKHGALSEKNGRLSVRWKIDSGGLLIQWAESDIGKLSRPSKVGFGVMLIERAVPFECNGEANVSFSDDGLSVRLWIPSVSVTILQPKTPPRDVEPEAPVVELGFTLQNVLIADDNMILALEMEQAIKDLGCSMVESVPSVEAGFRELELSSDYSLAILDINLGDSTSYELALRLQELNIPVIFATGYDSKFDMPAELQHFEHLTKPIEQTALVEAIRKTIG